MDPRVVLGTPRRQRDLKRCGHSSLFFNTFLNAHKVGCAA